MSMITFEYITDSPFKPTITHKLWLQQVIRQKGRVPGDISYIFCDDAYMLERNVAFLNHDTYTDIITFDETVGNIVSGSILISLERVAENAAIFGVPYENEFLRVLVHGTLHLCGFKDKTDEEAKRMREEENNALALLSDLKQ